MVQLCGSHFKSSGWIALWCRARWSTLVHSDKERKRAMPYCGLFRHCCHPVPDPGRLLHQCGGGWVGWGVGWGGGGGGGGAGKEKGRCRSELLRCTCSTLFALGLWAGTLHWTPQLLSAFVFTLVVLTWVLAGPYIHILLGWVDQHQPQPGNSSLRSGVIQFLSVALLWFCSSAFCTELHRLNSVLIAGWVAPLPSVLYR